MKEIQDEDFSKLYIPIHDSPDSLALIPAFKKLQCNEFLAYRGEKKININKVIRYISYLYSEHSPITSFYKNDLQARKETSAELSKFTKKEMTQVRKDLFELNDPLVVNMIVRFLVMQRNITWTEIVTLEQEHEEAVRLRLDPLTDATIKQKLRDACDKIIESLEKYYSLLFHDHTDVKDKYDEDDEIKQRMTSPEIVAEKLE